MNNTFSSHKELSRAWHLLGSDSVTSYGSSPQSKKVGIKGQGHVGIFCNQIRDSCCSLNLFYTLPTYGDLFSHLLVHFGSVNPDQTASQGAV